MCLSETKIFNTDLPILPNLNIHRVDRSNRGGGIAIMTNKNLNCKVIPLPIELFPYKSVECMILNIQLNRFKSFLNCLVYRPQFNLTNDDTDFFDRLLLELQKKNKDFYLCGDLNIHLEDTNNKQIQKFQKILSRNNVQILTSGPTRGEAQLDCFISNRMSNIVHNGVLDPQLSDHACCFIERECKIIKPKPRLITKRNYDRINLSELATLIVNTNFRTEGSLDDQIMYFIQTLVNIFDHVAPQNMIIVYDKKKKLVVSQVSGYKTSNDAPR